MMIFAILKIASPFGRTAEYPRKQVDIFMALALMESHMAAPRLSGTKSAEEDDCLLLGKRGPIIDLVGFMKVTV